MFVRCLLSEVSNSITTNLKWFLLFLRPLLTPILFPVFSNLFFKGKTGLVKVLLRHYGKPSYFMDGFSCGMTMDVTQVVALKHSHRNYLNFSSTNDSDSLR